MSATFHLMEEALKTYLTEAQSDSYNSRNANFYKYNNLKIYMDPKKNKIPHIIIRIGISEVMYNLDTWERLSGSLGSDERIVKKWIDRDVEKYDFAAGWDEAKKVKTVSMKQDADEDDD